MHNLSMTQVLGVWSELEAAFYDKSTYGGNTTEIYAYRLMPQSPLAQAFIEKSPRAVADGRFEGMAGEAAVKMLRNAARSLRAIILHFEETHQKCVVVLDAGGGEVPAAAWLSDNYFTHRIHLKVARPQDVPRDPLFLMVLEEPMSIGNLDVKVAEAIEAKDLDEVTPVVFKAHSDGKIGVYAMKERS